MRLGRQVVAAALAVLAVAACGGEGGDQADGGPAPARYGVGLRNETFVDPSRPTEARGNRPERTLVSEVYYPAAPAETVEPQEGVPAEEKPGGFPLVVFAHGSGGNPTFYRVLLRAWAAAGYVVVAPTFPLSSTMLRGAAADVVNQPRDVSFVVDEMLRLSADPQSPYAGRVDPDQIAVAGHSLGGETALAATFHSCCRDPRVKAAVVLAAGRSSFPADGYFADGAALPLLVVHGEADTTIPLADGERIFDDAPGPKVLLVLPTSDLPETDHTAPYVGSNGNPIPRTLLVITASTGFLDRYLEERPDGLSRLRTGVDQEVGYRLQIVD